jgi:hypothetical protein
MTRRQLFAFCAAALAALRWPRWTYGQDRQYEQAVAAAFSRFADVKTSRARIAPLDEPGLPLRIRGTLYRPDGTTPLAGALVFAYHTDRAGLYNNDNAAHSWRLQGAARTAADGTFEFETIRPASYPSTRIPQHVHVALATAVITPVNGESATTPWSPPTSGPPPHGPARSDGSAGWQAPATAPRSP